MARIEPRLAGYRPAQLAPLYQRIHESIAGIAGVSAVALCTYSPLAGGGWGYGVWVDGHPAPGPKEDDFAAYDRVTARYFAATGNPILKGRGISEQDTATSQHVAVINEAFARKFFKNENPIGKYFGRAEMASRQYEVVGIAKDARYLRPNANSVRRTHNHLVPTHAFATLRSLNRRDVVSAMFLSRIQVQPFVPQVQPVSS